MASAISPLSGRELEEARTVVPEATHQVSMRYHRDEITPGMRLVYNGRNLYVEHVGNVDERDRELMLVCVERK